jgi:hypothetical protein
VWFVCVLTVTKVVTKIIALKADKGQGATPLNGSCFGRRVERPAVLGTLTVSNSGLPHHSRTSFSQDIAIDCYFETAARPLAAIAVLVEWHTR